MVFGYAMALILTAATRRRLWFDRRDSPAPAYRRRLLRKQFIGPFGDLLP